MRFNKKLGFETEFIRKTSRVWLETLMVRGLNFGCNFLILSLTANSLSPGEFGYWIIFTGWPAFIVAFDFGLGNSLQNALSFRAAEQEERSFHELYLAGMRLLGLFSVVMAISSVICLGFMRLWDKELPEVNFVLEGLILAISVVLMIVSSTSQKALLAKLNFRVYSATSAANVLAQLAWSSMAWSCKLGLLFFCTAPIAGYLAVLWVGRGTLSQSRVNVKWLTLGDTYLLLRKSARGFALPQIMAQAFQYLPVLILGATSGAAIAGSVGGLLRATAYLVQIASIIALPLRPIFSHSYFKGDLPHCRTILRQSFILIGGIYSILAVVIICMGDWYLPLIVGKMASNFTAPTLVGLSLFIFAQAICQPVAAFLTGIDCLKGQVIYGSITVVVALLTIIPLSKLYGEAGVVAAMGLPFLVVNLPFALQEAKNKLKGF